jgi:predicted nuclease of predicted toxin-antitoxin system
VRVLLDECLPRRLRRALPDHEVRTVQELGWAGTKNGALLRRAASDGFEAFVTVDRNLEFQQHVPGLGLAVVALGARSNDITDLEPLMPAVLTILPTLTPGQVVRVPA